MTTNFENQDTNISLSSARVNYPEDFRDSLERTITESPAGRKETLRNNRNLSPSEKADERLEELLALPESVSDASRQALICYVAGGTLVRTSETLIPLGTAGLVVASAPWVALLVFVTAASRRKENLLGLAWRLTLMALGGL